MGEDAGWDRFIDNHVGLYVGDYVALDAWKATLDAAGVPYMPHVAGSFTDDAPQADQVVAGSIWTAGIGGLVLLAYFIRSRFLNGAAASPSRRGLRRKPVRRCRSRRQQPRCFPLTSRHSFTWRAGHCGTTWRVVAARWFRRRWDWR